MYFCMVMGGRVYKGLCGIPEPIGDKGMRRKWATIKVPAELKYKIYEMKEKQGKAAWQIVAESISFYDGMLRKGKHFSRTSDVDKISYYIMKLVTSATYLKMQQNQESLEKFKKTVEQVSERLNISCEELLPAAEKLIREKSGKSIHTFNMMLKSCITKLMFSGFS